MRDAFEKLAAKVCGTCTGDEVLLLNVAGETSDFTRFNSNCVRQAGSVRQQFLDLELISGQRHISETVTLTGSFDDDQRTCLGVLERLRRDLPQVPEDPYLLYATDVHSGEQVGENRLADTGDMIGAIQAAGEGHDLVGLLSTGDICFGFANSLGQRNWFSSSSYHFEWCLYAHGDKAVKSSCAGFEWDPEELKTKMSLAEKQLAILGRPAKTIKPGEYRIYLTPAALSEIVDMLGWGGFGLKAHRTKSTCLLKMVEDGKTFSPLFTLSENTADGLSSNFTDAGYILPDRVPLITEGRFDTCLVSPRSAKEYGATVNAGGEAPYSVDLAPGDLSRDKILEELGTGVFASQLWYLNWSDMPACRITGMTRFATFWVENGEIVAPLNVMRFDETGYRALGSNLIGLTRERDFIPDSSTYEARSTASLRLPGALVEDFRFTL